MKYRQINIRIDEKTADELDRLCAIHMRTRSDEIRFLIRQEFLQVMQKDMQVEAEEATAQQG